MCSLRPVLVLAVIFSANLFLCSAARADSIGLTVLTGSLVVNPGARFAGVNYELSGEGFTLTRDASEGVSSAFCAPCLVGDSVSASLRLSNLSGGLQHNGRTHAFDFGAGNGGTLQFFAPTFILQPGNVGSSVTFRTPIVMESSLRFSYPPFGDADTFEFGVGGSGIGTLTYDIAAFPDGPGGQQFVMREFRFDFGEQAAPVPEPTTILLLGSGLAAAAVRARRLSRKTSPD